MAKLVVNSDSLVSVADAIRTKGNTTDDLEFPNGFVNGINAIESGGGDTEEIENLIDASGVLESTDGTATEKVEQLVDRVKATYSFSTISCQDNKVIEHFAYDCKGIVNLNYAFYNCNKLKTITLTNTEKVLSLNKTFAGSSLINSIETLDMSSADKDYISKAQYSWINAPNLVNLKIAPKTIKTSITFVWCSKLTAESTQSIFDGLDPTATGQTLTLPKEFKNADGTTNTEAEAVVSANIVVVDGVTQIKGKEGWTLVR